MTNYNPFFLVGIFCAIVDNTKCFQLHICNILFTIKEKGKIMEILANRIYELREQYNMLQEELACILCVDRSTIAKYECNLREPDLKTLIHIADVFDVSVDYLLGRTNLTK